MSERPTAFEVQDNETQGAVIAQERIKELESRIALLANRVDQFEEKVALAYGHLWHVNNEPAAPIPIYTPEKAAYEARKILRDMLTSEQRGDAINATQHAWGDEAALAKGKTCN